jgi:hypothetical protein
MNAVKKNAWRTAMLVGALAATVSAHAQRQSKVLPLSRPGAPLLLKIDLPFTRIEVVGEERRDVELRMEVADSDGKLIVPSGTKPLPAANTQWETVENDNVVTVDANLHGRRAMVTARVPRRADLQLSTNNEGEIVVNGVAGELQLENGPISVSNVSGSVIAQTVNHPIDVAMTALSRQGATALSSLNGDISLSLPADTAAQLRLDTGARQIKSDFELDVRSGKAADADGDAPTVVAILNGGGPVISLKTLNGDISIRKSAGKALPANK